MPDLRPEIFNKDFFITKEGPLIDSILVENTLQQLSSIGELSDLQREEFSETLTRMKNKYVMKTSGGEINLIEGFEEVLDFINRYSNNWPDIS